MSAAARATLVALLAAAMLATTPARGWADADPPSDVLLTQDVYLPYQPKVAKPLAAALQATVARAKQAKYPLKVAVVATTADLGGVPNLFNRPAVYAPFLARELTALTAPTLVAMPAGLGVANATQPAAAAATGVRVDASKKSDALVRAVIEAIPKMATASGRPMPPTRLPPESAGKGGGGASPLIVFGAPVALVALAALAVALRRRGGADDADAEEAEPGEPSGVGSGG
jgi:hypothetical protein